MGFAILRIQKLKSRASLQRSFKHSFREQNTPNASREKLKENTLIGAKNSPDALAKFDSLLPEKVRKNAVLAVEYLITASPESMQSKDRTGQDAYFKDALDWLKSKHGAENVFFAGVHRDETTPHMYAYVVPKVGEKLNARHYFGGAKALSELQTDFAARVGRKHGLERGLEGSKARHTSIQAFYARMNNPPEMDALELALDVEARIDEKINKLADELGLQRGTRARTGFIASAQDPQKDTSEAVKYIDKGHGR
jgi:hypothetical protein